MEVLGGLAARLAHDFRNILAVIKGTLELLADENLPAEERRDDLEMASSATARGADFARAQAPRHDNVDVGETLGEVFKIIQLTMLTSRRSWLTRASGWRSTSIRPCSRRRWSTSP